MLPIVWLAGAPGVGKSTIGWRVFASTPGWGYLDIDQLGMLYPDRPGDEEAHVLKQRALSAMLPNYVAARATRLLVSGVVDPALATDPAAPLAPDIVDYLLLVADPDELRRRVLDRGWSKAAADRSVGLQEDLVDSGFAPTVVPTGGRSVSEVAAEVRTHVARRGRRVAGTTAASSYAGPTLPSVFITGPRVAGCSSVGFALASLAWERGDPTGFADLGQLSFRRRRAAHADPHLGLANLGALSRVFAEHGARRFLANGHVLAADQVELLRRTLGPTVVVCLRADPDTLRSHLRSRLGGSEARLAGDDLVGATGSHQRSVLERAVAELGLVQRTASYDLVVDVTGRSVAQTAREIAATLL